MNTQKEKKFKTGDKTNKEKAADTIRDEGNQ